MQRISKLIILLMLAICSWAPVGAKKPKPEKAIVCGRLFVNSDKPVKIYKFSLHFNNRRGNHGTGLLTESGYFSLDLPCTKNAITIIEYFKKGSFFKNIPEDYLTFDIADNTKIYYIGDITIDWTPHAADARTQNGIIGAIAESKEEGEKLPVKVTSSQESIDHFKERYKNHPELQIVTELLHIAE